MPTLTEAKAQIVACTDCHLHKACTAPVPFRGGRSKIMVVGSAPASREDQQGRPFVGTAGRLLWRELAAVGINKQDVTVAYAVCCYPGKRKLVSSEIYACRKNLWRQVHYVRPDIILALGNTPNWSFGQQTKGIKDLRGTIYPLMWFASFTGFADEGIPVFAAYHPASVGKSERLRRIWREDLTAFAIAASSLQ